MDERQTPDELREGVRAGIVWALRRDVELRGWRTVRLLVLAGVVGVAGALGATLLVVSHPFDHHPTWHVATFSALWAGLLVVTLAIALLELRTPSLPLARSAAVGVIGLGIAGLCGVACPDGHFLNWWSSTPLGARLMESTGLAVSALCFGLVTTIAFAAGSALLVSDPTSHPPMRPLLPAALLVLLLTPGVVLQTVGTSVSVFANWMAGSAAGAYVGVALGMLLRSVLQPR